MAKRKKISFWRKLLTSLLSPKLWLSITLVLITTALLSLAMIADNAYDQWRVDQKSNEIYGSKTQDHLNNIAPMIALCESRGGTWIWIGIDQAEVSGLCTKATQQKGTEKRQNYIETL